jgi:hypothetical protein
MAAKTLIRWRMTTSSTAVRDPLVTDLLATAIKWSVPEKAAEIKRDCWDKIGFDKCFRTAFQAQAAMAVGEDNEGRYFKEVVGTSSFASFASFRLFWYPYPSC